MKLHSIFYHEKKRHIILWMTDIIVAIASYFYLTNPVYIKTSIEKIDFTSIRPDLDPQVLQSPEFFHLMQNMMTGVALIVTVLIVLFHGLAFYQSYKGKKAAISYVKVYSFLAAFSLFIWLVYNFEVQNIWILIPLKIYVGVFLATDQRNKLDS